MSLRGLLALVAVAVVAVGGTVLDSVDTRAAHSSPPATAFSGAWYCPHGGGQGWHVELSVTNPGPHPVQIRVTTFDRGGPNDPSRITVPAMTEMRVSVKAESRGSSTQVEYFDGWVSASWIALGGGNESGLAAEPCTKQLGTTWFMPDGGDLANRGEDSWVVVMNPTARPAIFTIRVVTDHQAIVTEDWTDILLRPGHSTAFHLNQKALGKRTVTASIQATIGRVAAASLGASRDGGIRAAIGIPAPEHEVVLPGGPESGRSDVLIGDAGSGRATYTGSLERPDGTQALGQFRGESLQADQARTYDIATTPGSAMVIRTLGSSGIAVVRRSYGPGSDQASTAGATPAAAWVVPSADVSPRDEWRLVLANPGKDTVSVQLWLVSASGVSEKLSPRVVNVAPGRSRAVAVDFTTAARLGSVVALASNGTFVPVATSSTGDGRGYAAAVGVPIPPRWVPATLD